jgi:hypothetical protein
MKFATGLNKILFSKIIIECLFGLKHYLSGFAAFVGANYSRGFQLIHNPTCAVVSKLESALQQGG